jgi:hypothetical protein
VLGGTVLALFAQDLPAIEGAAVRLAGESCADYADSMSPERRPPDVDDEFLTVAEVAAILKLNQQTVRNWIDAPR